jgi:hypothetical protein
MRFSRPELPKLNLDLAHFNGGGRYPTLFEGVTREGRSIHARYRSGWLRIAFDDSDEALLQAKIGDANDGDMLLEQVCDLAGITIQGEMPVLTPEALERAIHEAPVKDWSGRTIYWSFDLKYTPSAGQTFLCELEDILPGMLVSFEYHGKDNPSSRWVARRLSGTIDCCGIYCLGMEPSECLISSHLLFEHYRDFDRSRRVDMKMPTDTKSREFDRYNSAFSSKLSGREVHIYPTFGGRIRGEIRSDNAEEQRMLEGIEALVSRHFSNRRKSVEIGTEEVIDRFESPAWYSRDLIEWCDPRKMRFIGATIEKGAPGRSIGYLPDP